ncbi:phosphopantetheine binding protein [Streptomyces sp. TLI_235]|nr:acyl carrier protein [Streptomyces sp. TLI_235]PBC78952.1 phosphopantetheine binding protein [Streptomyces sp. TLI_235]
MESAVVDDVVRAEWCDVLDVESPSPDDDFFGLGGNSLLAVTLIERIEARLEIEIPLEDFFVDGRLATLLDGARSATAR